MFRYLCVNVLGLCPDQPICCATKPSKAASKGWNLSKRTQVYGSYALLSIKAGAQKSIGVQGLTATGTTLGGNSSGYEVGIRHSF